MPEFDSDAEQMLWRVLMLAVTDMFNFWGKKVKQMNFQLSVTSSETSFLSNGKQTLSEVFYVNFMSELAFLSLLTDTGTPQSFNSCLTFVLDVL